MKNKDKILKQVLTSSKKRLLFFIRDIAASLPERGRVELKIKIDGGEPVWWELGWPFYSRRGAGKVYGSELSFTEWTLLLELLKIEFGTLKLILIPGEFRPNGAWKRYYADKSLKSERLPLIKKVDELIDELILKEREKAIEMKEQSSLAVDSTYEPLVEKVVEKKEAEYQKKEKEETVIIRVPAKKKKSRKKKK